ncbi:DUF6531 domain-containing protein [Stenotrophomonas maltophilia]|uniref:DUF6531 domain-containing protein n=1 Tax=Stenotrophomonas maltophilia TaxID=40324 RepID=UPI000AAD16DD
MKDYGWAAAAIKGCVSAVLVFIAASAGAQETTPRWYRDWNYPPLEYASESEAQVAVKAMAAALKIVVDPVNWGVRGHTMTNNRFVTIYGVKPTPIKRGPWVYSYAGVGYPSEEAVLSVMRSGNATLCPVTVPTPVWVSTKGVGKDPENSTHEEWTKGVTISWRTLRGGCLTNASYVTRTRDVKCPNPDTMKWKDELAGCVLSDPIEANHRLTMSYYTKQTPKLCHGVGNPCDPTTGEKVQREPELDLPWIRMDRHYHSKSQTVGGGFGANWTHTHNVRMAILPSAGTSTWTGFIDEDGSHVAFQQKTGSFYLATDGSGDRAEFVYNVGWIVRRRTEVLRFSRIGLIQQREYEDGTTLSYSHDGAGRLKEIRHSTGRKVEFSYADAIDEKIAALTINGAPYASYSYGDNDQLASVTYADGRSRLYHYEDSRFPWHLTGVTAEDGRRLSWFGYDEKGRVTCSRHDAGCN